MILMRIRLPLPDSEDYRRLDPSTYDDQFYQEEGLLREFTINLPNDEDMGVHNEEHEAEGMEEDNPQDKVEEVQNQQD
jgi:hypothetical protein